MSNYEELNNPAIEELNPEALEQAAGGAGSEGKRLKVIKDTKVYNGYGQVFDTKMRKGTVFEHYQKCTVDNLAFKCYRVVWMLGAVYIPCDCAEII